MGESATVRNQSAKRLTEQEELENLVAACKRGDGAAWKKLYDTYFSYMYRTARKLGTPEAELDDVVSEVFLVVYRKLDDFQYGRITTWLFRICSNVVSGFHRKRRTRRSLQQLKESIGLKTTETETPHLHAERTAAEAAVTKILEGMSPKNREVIVLFELEGLSGEEIALQVGCPVGTVWTRLHNARKQFKKIARRLGLSELGETE